MLYRFKVFVRHTRRSINAWLQHDVLGGERAIPGNRALIEWAAITTEGFLAPKGGAQITLYIIGGIIGLGIVGLLITFLPTVYTIYSQREEEVTRVAFRFGVPPSGVRVLAQTNLLGLAEELDGFWSTWEEWFTDMDETHLSNSEVIFYRSCLLYTSDAADDLRV